MRKGRENGVCREHKEKVGIVRSQRVAKADLICSGAQMVRVRGVVGQR